MRIKLYMDEDVPFSLTQALINRGVDVITTQQANNSGKADQEQLEYALKTKRILFTHNKKDFIILHKEFLQNDLERSGIIVSDQISIGILLKRLMKLWFIIDLDEMKNRIEFLSSWK